GARGWREALAGVVSRGARRRAEPLLARLHRRAERDGVAVPFNANTPYVNTIGPDEEPPFPGDRDLERKIKSLIRWNAMAMVVQANETDKTIGGHTRPLPRTAPPPPNGSHHP